MRLFSVKRKSYIRHHAHVFISRSEETAVIATLHFNGKGGILFEENQPVVLLSPLTPIILGQAILDALRRTTIGQLNSSAMQKLTDWPAFKASKAKSVRQFEQNFIRILVSGANDVNLVYVIDGEPFKDAELHVTSTISSAAPPAKLGECVISVFHACCNRQI
jgi:hypothetical protein